MTILALTLSKGKSNQNTTSFDKVIYSWVLSWTTFSTVGYDSIYPAHGNSCIFVRTVAGLEGFLGILYVGFCGAIFFSKVVKMQRQALVEFAAPICLRYNLQDIDESTLSSDEILST